MYAPAPFIIGTRRDIVLLSPAAVEFRAVHLLAWSAGIAGGYNGIVFIHDYRAEIPPQAGALVGAPLCKIKKILVPVSPHQRIMEKPGY